MEPPVVCAAQTGDRSLLSAMLQGRTVPDAVRICDDATAIIVQVSSTHPPPTSPLPSSWRFFWIFC